MKKNIMMNLFGSLYAIDEDAYDLLNRYQNDMRRYFSKREGGTEIADDIEHRVAELMAELKAQGVEAITIEHVEDIIRRIGNPEDMEAEDTEAATGSSGRMEEKPVKNLFRNPDDKMLGGVCSGLAYFFGTDVLVIRLLAVVLGFLTQGVMVGIYIVMWLLVPEANTPEQKLRMQGKKINMESLREEILKGTARAGEYVTAPETKTKARGCLSSLLYAIVILLKALLVVIAVGVGLGLVLFLFTTLFGIGMGLFASVAGVGSLFVSNVDSVLLQTLESLPAAAVSGFWISAISLLFVLGIPLYVMVHVLLKVFGRSQSVSSRIKWMLVVVWILSAILFSVFTVTTFVSFADTRRAVMESIY